MAQDSLAASGACLLFPNSTRRTFLAIEAAALADSKGHSFREPVYELAEGHHWPWTVEAVFNPATVFKEARDVVVISSDAAVIDGSERWFNLAVDIILSQSGPDAWLADPQHA